MSQQHVFSANKTKSLAKERAKIIMPLNFVMWPLVFEPTVTSPIQKIIFLSPSSYDKTGFGKHSC